MKFKELSEQKKKTTNDEALLMFMCNQKVKDPILEKEKFIKSLEKRRFKTRMKLRKWLWWNVGIKAEKAKEKMLNKSCDN